MTDTRQKVIFIGRDTGMGMNALAKLARLQEPPPDPVPHCPNCSLPRRPLHWTGDVFRCVSVDAGGCGGWWGPLAVKNRPEVFGMPPEPPEAA